MTARASRSRRRLLAFGAAIAGVALIGGLALVIGLGPLGRSVVSLEIEPAGVLMTATGETRTLRARGIDANGASVDVQVTWKALKPATVSIDGNGTVTAAAFGSGQVVAQAGSVTSSPLLVVVAKPAEGVILVGDDDIVGDPIEVDPSAAPSASNAYRVTLRSARPDVGSLLLGTGGKPLAGRVVEVRDDQAGRTVVMRLVPLEELLPDLDINESLDLGTAAVQYPEAVARLYDITRDGSTFTFTPKGDFQQLITSDVGRSSDVRWLARDRTASLGEPLFAPAAVGTRALGPFECQFATTPGADSTPLSLSGTTPPSFSVEVSPGLDVTYTPANGLERFVVSATARAKVTGGIKVSVAFEGKVTCEVELFQFKIPVGGALSFFISGLVPVKAGLELGGKLTVANAELGAEASVEATISTGIVCAAGSGCELQRSLSGQKHEFKPKVDGPSWTDVRLEPGFELSAGLDLAVGNPIFTSLRLEVVKAKAGLKLGADWAPQTVQINDAAYASSYKLGFEIGISIGAELGEVATLLGLGSIAAAEYKITKDLAVSPTGTVTFDRPNYAAGESGVAHVSLDATTVEFLGGYNVARLLLVAHTLNGDVPLGSATATSGQREFDIAFVAPGLIRSADLFGFVVANFPALDIFALELGRGCDQAMSDAWVQYFLEKTFTGTLTASNGAARDERLYFDPPPDSEGLALYIADGITPITVTGSTFSGGGWTGTFSIVCDGPDRRAKVDATSSTLGRFEGLAISPLPASPGGD